MINEAVELLDNARIICTLSHECERKHKAIGSTGRGVPFKGTRKRDRLPQDQT